MPTETKPDEERLTPFYIGLSADMNEALEKMAADLHTKRAEVGRQALLKHLRENGYLPEPGAR